MSNLVQVVLILSGVLAAVALYKPVLRALRKFEERNAERRMQELKSAMDAYSHYRQTMEFVEEQIEPVSTLTVRDERTGEPLTRYVFLGVWYAARQEAEAARYAAIVEKAREFYVDLDRVFLSRRRSRWSGSVALTDPSRHQTRTPPRN
jgi:hypothetical protein